MIDSQHFIKWTFCKFDFTYSTIWKASLNQSKHPSQTTIRPNIKGHTYTHKSSPLPLWEFPSGVLLCHLDAGPPCRTCLSGNRESVPRHRSKTGAKEEHVYKTGTKPIYKSRSKTTQHSPTRILLFVPLPLKVSIRCLILRFLLCFAFGEGIYLAWPMRVANTSFLRQMGGSSFKTNEGRKYIFKWRRVGQ